MTDTVPEQPAAGHPEDRIVDRAQLWAALGALSERQRAVLVLRYYESMADRDIATPPRTESSSPRSAAVSQMRARVKIRT